VPETLMSVPDGPDVGLTEIELGVLESMKVAGAVSPAMLPIAEIV
jgi:hypothetical protein